jgi:hypothetical protein
MATYAVIENGTVINVIVADSQEIAEQVTEKTCIEYTEEAPLGIGWYWLDAANAYVPIAPFASWTYNVELGAWVAPVEMPVEEGKYFMWNEDTLSWDSHLNPVIPE